MSEIDPHTKNRSSTLESSVASLFYFRIISLFCQDRLTAPATLNSEIAGGWPGDPEMAALCFALFAGTRFMGWNGPSLVGISNIEQSHSGPFWRRRLTESMVDIGSPSWHTNEARPIRPNLAPVSLLDSIQRDMIGWPGFAAHHLRLIDFSSHDQTGRFMKSSVILRRRALDLTYKAAVATAGLGWMFPTTDIAFRSRMLRHAIRQAMRPIPPIITGDGVDA